jgi:hypothetical protein
MQHITRLRSIVVPLMAVVLALATAACGDEGDNGTSTGATSGATSGCDEVNALKDSLTSLTGVDPVADGTDALESAASDVKTDLNVAVSAVGAELQPAVDEVKTSFDELATALQGVSSGGLGAAATEVGNALAELGTALNRLTSEISQTC